MSVGPVHPDLAKAARFLPRGGVGRRTTPILQRLQHRAPVPPQAGVEIGTVTSPGLRTYRPEGGVTSGAALLWIHGGGMVIGRPEQDDELVARMSRELGILIASADYRLAPQHPYPAAIDDCYAALAWLHAQPGVDPAKVAVGGASAGGGLAASLVQVAHDRGELPVAFQLLVYPMLDDRSGSRPDPDRKVRRLWSAKANRWGWAAYLGPSAASAPAVPARREDLAGLPPAWIGIGTHDLFHAEDLDYARRLEEAGVPCELHVVPGAFHGFDVVRKVPVVKDFHARQIAALRSALL